METERDKLLRMEVEWMKHSYLDMSEPTSIQQLVKTPPHMGFRSFSM